MKPQSIDSYEKIESEAKSLLSKMAKGSSNHMLKEIAEEMDESKKHEYEVNARVIRMIINECLEEYCEGEYDLNTTVKNITEALAELKKVEK